LAQKIPDGLIFGGFRAAVCCSMEMVDRHDTIVREIADQAIHDFIPHYQIPSAIPEYIARYLFLVRIRHCR